MIDKNTQSQGENLVGSIIESFLKRFRNGERPALSDLVSRYPDLAEELQEIIPALVNLEQLGNPFGSTLGSPPLTSRSLETALPDRLGDYRILRRIGGGGMGVVYEAEHESLKSHVALKMMHPRFRTDEKYLRRFHIEAQAAAGLHHTNIVSVFDYGEQEGVFYYAMQFIRGQSLDLVLKEIIQLRATKPDREGTTGRPKMDVEPATAFRKTRTIAESLRLGRFEADSPREGSDSETAIFDPTETQSLFSTRSAASPRPMSETPVEPPNSSSFNNSSLGGSIEGRYFREVARVGSQVADALAYAHRAGVLHRDIKPSNLILDALGNVWITDFGLAKFEEGEGASESKDLVGTLRYMAPERFKGSSNRCGDTYALGATLYELVTLKPAFEDGDPVFLINRIANEPPISPRQIDSRVPRDLETIIMKALAKDPRERFASAEELAEELRKFVAGLPIRSRPISTAEQAWRWCKRNPLLAAASLAAVATTLTLAIGSTIAARVYYDGREKITTTALTLERTAEKLKQSERATSEKLFQAKLIQARASRTSRRIGQRFDGLNAITEAVKIGRDLGYSRDQFDSLRDEAIGCMALTDAQREGRPIPKIEGSIVFAHDFAMTRYANRFENGEIVIHRLSDNQEIGRYALSRDGEKDIRIFNFSPDGRYLMASDGPDRKLIVWDIDRNVACLTDPGPISVSSACFSPDSRRLILTREDQSVVTYDLASATTIHRWQDDRRPSFISFRPDGRLIAVVDREDVGHCRIMKAESGELLRVLPLEASLPGFPAWSPDGETLAIPDDSEKVFLWSSSTGEFLTKLEMYGSGINTAFHPSGDILATNGWENRLRLWDPISKQLILQLNNYRAGHLSFGKNGRIVVTHEDSHQIHRVHASAEYRGLAHKPDPPLLYRASSFSPDGRLLAAATQRGVVLWELATGIELGFLPLGETWSCQFLPGYDLLTSGDAGTLRWSISRDPTGEGTKIGPPRVLSVPVSYCAISADREATTIAIPMFSEASVSVRENVFSIGPLDDCRSVSVSPDGRWVATAEFSLGGTSIWKLPEATLVAKMPMKGITLPRFSPDDRWLMTSTPTGSTLWEVGTWREVRKTKAIFKGFSPDGRISVFQFAGKELALIDTESGRILTRLIAQDEYDTEVVTFSPDGSTLAVPANERPCVHIWDLRAIRQNLQEMGLDWDAPAFPKSDGSSPGPPSARPLTVDYGPFKNHLERYSKSPEELITLNTNRIERDNKDASAYHTRAHALEELGRISEASEDFSKAIALDPGDISKRECRGKLWAREIATMDIALNDLEAALKLDPSRVDLRWLVALCSNNVAWSLSSTPQIALRLSARAVEFAPDQQIYLNTHGVILYRAGRLDEALPVLEKSLALGHGRYDGFDLFFLAMAYHRLGRPEKAHECFDRANLWLKGNPSLSGEQAKEITDFQAEAKLILAGPASELPDDVFSPIESANHTTRGH